MMMMILLMLVKTKRMTIMLDKTLSQSNVTSGMLSASKLYNNITLQQLATLLEIEPRKVCAYIGTYKIVVSRSLTDIVYI